MSDVSKTNDLIEEARNHRSVDPIGNPKGVLIGRLADVLAARQPTKDDREALANILLDAREADDGLSAVRDRIIGAGFSRAVVPDAATAAVERVRAVLSNDELVWSDGSYTNVLVVEVKDILAALDGAPEPETAPENYEPKCNGACVVHGSPVTDWSVQYGRRQRETGALHWLNGDPFDSWWHENQGSYEHVKRYTSPPLPVEGESKA